MHFTYKDPSGYLQQGDIIARSEAVESALREIHPYYFQNQDYQYLMVLTQSCDLVPDRRGAECKARYINLAAVRPLATALRFCLDMYQRSPRERRLGYCSESSKELVEQFLRRLLNNNQSGYFYLHSENGFGIPNPMVAFLHLSIAIKSGLHYQTLLESRIAQIAPQFQAKLGWLLGDIYSRVATDDWVPTACSQEEFDSQIDQQLEQLCYWINQKMISKIAQIEKQRKGAQGPDYEISKEELEALIEEFSKQRETKKEEFIQRAVEIAADVSPGIDQQKLALRLKNDPIVAQFLR